MLLFLPQWYHHFLLPSIFLLLNLLPHSFSVNFPRNPVGSNLRKKSFAPVMGTLSLLNKEGDVYHTGGYCLDTLRPRNSFVVVMLKLCIQKVGQRLRLPLLPLFP